MAALCRVTSTSERSFSILEHSINVILNASVVGLDIGAKTDYDATETRMLKRACCHSGSSSFGKRKVSVFQYSGAFYQCHINLI